MEEKKKKSRRTPGGAEDFLTHSSQLERAKVGGREKESLGERIRKAREAHNLTVDELSARTGIDADILKHVEANIIIPPLGDLVKLGKALETRMGFFISPGVDKTMTLVRAHQRKSVSRHVGKSSARYGYLYESLAPEKANRLMEPFMITLTPAEEVEPSTHDGQEFLFVLEGQMMARVGDRTEHLGPGDAIYYDSSEPHFVKCVGGKETRMLAVLYTGR
jgi:quercetin dioxygenase-like cupin family protein